MIKVIRDKVQEDNSTVLKGKEFNNAVLDTISSTAQQIKERTQTQDIINDCADILELINAYLNSENIKTDFVFNELTNLRNSLGTYSKKLSINKD